MRQRVPVVVVNDTRVDRHHGCQAVMSAILALLDRYAMAPLYLVPAQGDWRRDAGFAAALARARLVLVNGEGTIHHDRPAGRRLVELGRHARAAGVPVALVNAGWEGNGPDLAAMLTDFDLVAARDSRSAQRMRAGGASVRVVPDLSLWFAQHPPVSGQGRAGIGVTDNVERLKSLDLERLRRACGGQVLAIGYGDPGIAGWAGFLRDGVSLSQDFRHPARLAALLRQRNALWHRASADTVSFIRRVAGFDLVVSGRFHACTLALATGTPVVAQASNTDKIAALFEDAGLARWRGEMALDPAAVRAARARGWAADERDALRAYCREAVTAAESLFADLARLAAA